MDEYMHIYTYVTAQIDDDANTENLYIFMMSAGNWRILLQNAEWKLFRFLQIIFSCFNALLIYPFFVSSSRSEYFNIN